MTQKTNPRDQRATLRQTKQNKTTFGDHIGEIRRRVVVIVAAFLITSALAYNYHEWLTKFIMHPLGGEKLVYLTPGGGFNFIFQISMYAGLLVIAPLIIYHIYGFLRPALPKRAQQSAVLVIVCAVLLMAAGAVYGYMVAVPSALAFLATFAGAEVTPNLTADSYLGFFLTYIVGLGVLFELPLLLLFIHWVKPMTPGGLLKSERFVIAGAFIVAALITPTPDVFNQLMIAVPLIAIYQLGAAAVLIAIFKQKKRASEVARIASTAEPLRPFTTTPPPRALSQPPIAAPSVLGPQKGIDMVIRPARPASMSVPRNVRASPQTATRSTPTRPARRLSVDGISNPL